MKRILAGMYLAIALIASGCASYGWPGREPHDLEIKSAAEVWASKRIVGNVCEATEVQSIAGRSVELQLRDSKQGCEVTAWYSPGLLSRFMTLCWKTVASGNWACGAWPG